MNNLQQIFRILNPAIRGIPLIVGVIAIMVFIATRIVRYSTPMYECTGKLKLEDPNVDIANTNLFKNFDIFTQPTKIMAEVEVIKSPEMLKATLKNLTFAVSYFRVGNIRTSELYYDSPINVSYTISDNKFYGINFNVHIKDTSHFELNYVKEGKTFQVKAPFEKHLLLEGISLDIRLNKEVLKNKPGIDIKNHYYFIIHSEAQQIEILKEFIDVKELDKDIPVIRVICKHPVPEKAMLLTNTLIETYIDEGIKLKTGAAKKTMNFIDKQLKDISDKLSISENVLETYRMKNKITNTKIEVETDLKKVAQLKIQLINVEMNLATLDTLDLYTNQDSRDFLLKAPNYEGYGGLLYTELMKRLKELQGEKKDLLLKYTTGNEKVKVTDEKISDLVNYIKQNIHNSKNAMRIQRDRILSDIDLAEIPFKDVPSKEKNMVILEREFRLNQEIYNFLNEKRTESNIAQAATFSFHRIIQRATVPTKPVTPKKTFTILVFGFLGLLFSIAIVYIYDAISSRVKYKDQLEKNSTCPVLGDIRHENQKGGAMTDFFTLATKLIVNGNESQVITVTSGIDNEGKTFVAERLARAFAAMQIPVLLVGSNLRNKTIGKNSSFAAKQGFSEFIANNLKAEECCYKSKYEGLYIMPEGNSPFIPEAILINPKLVEKINKLKELFPVIILDSPSLDTSTDALPLMRTSDTSLYIFRANYSKTKMIMEPDILKEEYKLENIRLVLNEVEGFAKMKKDRGIRKSLDILKRKIVVFIKRRKSSLTNV